MGGRQIERGEGGRKLTGALLLLAAVAVSFAVFVTTSSREDIPKQVNTKHEVAINVTVGDVQNVSPSLVKPKPRFTQAWSTGHVGTRFLTNLFRNAEIGRDDPNGTLAYTIFWNERNMELGNPASYNGSLMTFARSWEKGSKHWYDPQLKEWNDNGDYDSIRRFIFMKREPAIKQVFNAFAPNLEHMVKFGHTAIFLDLPFYYEVMVEEFRFDLIRIHRRRTLIARSFAEDRGRKEPCGYRRTKAGINTCPWYRTSLLIPLKSLWSGWTLFQKYLWFVDEVEARWQQFLSEFPEAKVHDLFYSSEDKLEAKAIDELAAFLEVPSPSAAMKTINHMSHLQSGGTMSSEQMKTEAEAYEKAAPWCKNNSLFSNYSIDCDFQA